MKIHHILSILALAAIPALQGAVVVEQITTANNSPATTLTEIQNTFDNFPAGAVHLGAWQSDAGDFDALAKECIADHITLTFLDGSTKARYEKTGGDFVIYAITTKGGSGQDQTKNLYVNTDDGTTSGNVLAFPDFYEFLDSTINPQSGALTEFSDIYFFGAKLSAVPEPATVISLMTIGFIGLVAFRRHRSRKDA